MDFWDQLQEFSAAYYRRRGIKERQSPWGGNEWKNGAPKGAIIHYTADADVDRVLKWFMQEKYQSGICSHVVVGSQWTRQLRELVEGLPLVDALPVPVFQCRPPEVSAVHAVGVNRTCYGIEVVNVGELKFREGLLYTHWRRNHDPEAPEWSEPWQGEEELAQKDLRRWWAPYSPAQFEAVILVLRELRKLYKLLQPAWVLGHDNVQGAKTLRSSGTPLGYDKRDPGALFPLHQVREIAFSDQDDYPELDLTVAKQDRFRVMECFTGGVDRLSHEPMSALIAREKALCVLMHKLKDGSLAKSRENEALKVGLYLLGYWITSPFSDTLSDWDREAVYVFQRLMGLTSDRIPGKKTKAALVERLADRGLF